MRAAFLLFSFLAVSSFAHADTPKSARSGLKMEGVFASQGTPVVWSAIINGEVVTAGQKVGDYEVLRVDEKGAKVRDLQTGAVEFLEPGALKQKAAELPPPAPKPWVDQVLEKFFPKAARMKEQAEYAEVLKDLRKIHFEAMQHSITDARPVSIPELVSLGKLPPSFHLSTSAGYRFEILNLEPGAGVRVRAEPLQGKTRRRYFLMDEHTYIYSEEGKPATQLSPRFESGYSVEITPV